LKAKKLPEAKSEIDKVMGLPANQKNPEAFYTKAKIYVEISQDPQLNKQYPNARMDAYNALKKYTEIDDKMLIALQIDGYKPINDIYTGYYQTAANAFNNKEYATAYTGFVNAIMVSKFMTEKGWIKLSLDTNSVLYAGVSAEKLSRMDDAVNYYGQLVKAKATSEGFVEIYKWTANYHFEKKNYSEATNFINIGKEVYPDDPFWSSIEIDLIRVNGSRDQLFSKYEEVIANNPANHLYPYNYAVELYQYGYNLDPTKRPANSEAIINKAQENIISAIRLKTDYAKAQLFAGPDSI
jgi:tetratricopeptide (TPR) repeat protein